MKYFQETTVWNTEYRMPNHVWYMSDDRSRAVGYIPAGSKKLQKFSTPLAIDVRGRKFVQLSMQGESDEVYFPKKVSATKEPTGVVVQGSGGKQYTVSKIPGGWQCTCTGYMYRRKCKHVQSMG